MLNILMNQPCPEFWQRNSKNWTKMIAEKQLHMIILCVNIISLYMKYITLFWNFSIICLYFKQIPFWQKNSILDCGWRRTKRATFKLLITQVLIWVLIVLILVLIVLIWVLIVLILMMHFSTNNGSF